MSFLCEYCNLLYTTKNSLTRHQNTNKCKNRRNLINNGHRIYNENITNRDNIELLKLENEKLKLENEENNYKKNLE